MASFFTNVEIVAHQCRTADLCAPVPTLDSLSDQSIANLSGPVDVLEKRDAIVLGVAL